MSGSAAVIDDRGAARASMHSFESIQHPVRRRHDGICSRDGPRNRLAIGAGPFVVWRLLAMYRLPPRADVTVGHNESRNITTDISVIKLAEVQKIRLHFVDEREQKLR